MRKNSYVLLCAVLLAATAQLIAQTPPPPPAPRAINPADIIPSNVVNPLRETFTSVSEGFAIGLPSQLSGFSSQTYSIESGPMKATEYTWRLTQASFTLASFVPSADLTKPEIRQSFAESWRTKSIAEFEKSGGRILGERALLRFLPGFEIKYEFPKLLLTNRVMFTGKRLLVLNGFLPRNASLALQAELVNILDSFKLLSEMEIAALLQKRVEAATPAPLPQEPVIAKAKTDAQDENLHGVAKTVLRETVSLTNNNPQHIRSSQWEFDQRGWLLKKETYNSLGEINYVEVYGFLEGRRVMKRGWARSESGPPPPAPPAVRPDNTTVQPAPDKRFENAYSYQYDAAAGQRERIMYDNSLNVSRRTVIQFKGIQREEILYDAGGKAIGRTVILLDGKNNELEKSYFSDGVKQLESKYAYSDYKFDAQNNWTLRKVAQWNATTETFEPAWMEYRTITYHSTK